MKSMEQKRGFSDTLVQTTHLLKKCVLVPNSDNQKKTQTSFKRGVMDFEDFNYSLYNQYILVEKKSDESDNEDINLALNAKDLRIANY